MALTLNLFIKIFLIASIGDIANMMQQMKKDNFQNTWPKHEIWSGSFFLFNQ
jgi:hypothetical protein